MKTKLITILSGIILFLLILISPLRAEETPLPENLIISDSVDITQFHDKKMKYIDFSDENIDKKALLTAFLPEKLLSDYEEVNIIGKTIKDILPRTLIPKNQPLITYEQGPFGYVSYKNFQYVKNPGLLSLSSAEKESEDFIIKYFGEIPEDNVKRVKSYIDPFEGEGFKIIFNRVFTDKDTGVKYNILSSDKYLGDFMEVRIFKRTGLLKFERMWHDIDGYVWLLYGTLKPLEEILVERFKEELKSEKRLIIEEAGLVYYFNPVKLLNVISMRPAYRINCNGEVVYVDGFTGGRVPWIKKMASSMKIKNVKILLPEDYK